MSQKQEKDKRQILLDGIILPPQPTLIAVTTRPIILDGIILPATTKPIVLDGFLPPKTIIVATTPKPPVFVTKPPVIFDGVILPTKSFAPASTTASSNVYAESSSAPPLVLPTYGESESSTAPQYSGAATSSSKYAGTDVEKAASNGAAVDAKSNPNHTGVETDSASQQMASLLLVVIIVLFHVAF